MGNITGDFHELRDQSEDFANQLDCGWNGFPDKGGLTIRFYDKDEDDFAWELDLNFQPVVPGSNMAFGAEVTLDSTELQLKNGENVIEQDIEVAPEKLPTFSHVAAVVLQARKLKPFVSPAEKIAREAKKMEEAAKEQMANMGIKLGNK